jgi:hypothetical protein
MCNDLTQPWGRHEEKAFSGFVLLLLRGCCSTASAHAAALSMPSFVCTSVDLHHPSPCFVQAITYNKALREQIDNLRRERMMFEAINTNLDKELARIKRNIADTISAANVAHTAKEKALAEVAALKLQAEKDHASFEEEWRQLTHIIEEDRYV